MAVSKAVNIEKQSWIKSAMMISSDLEGSLPEDVLLPYVCPLLNKHLGDLLVRVVDGGVQRGVP